uniref:Uncharacterized protein n=1 Tax=Glossina pallidipes TaxID=7398 RepID=A0A1B0A2H1_GLOPL
MYRKLATNVTVLRNCSAIVAPNVLQIFVTNAHACALSILSIFFVRLFDDQFEDQKKELHISDAAKRPQCKSRLLTKQHDALCLVISCIQDDGLNFIRAYGMNIVESSSRILPTLKSLGGLGKCSVTNHCNRGHPLNFAISPVLDFGSPFKQASDVNATVIPHELNKKPTCCGGVSDVDNGNSIGSGTSPRNMHPYQAVMKLQWNFNLDKNNH